MYLHAFTCIFLRLCHICIILCVIIRAIKIIVVKYVTEIKIYNINLKLKNFFSFDSLQPIQLLQILNDVMSEINPQVSLF